MWDETHTQFTIQYIRLGPSVQACRITRAHQSQMQPDVAPASELWSRRQKN